MIIMIVTWCRLLQRLPTKSRLFFIFSVPIAVAPTSRRSTDGPRSTPAPVNWEDHQSHRRTQSADCQPGYHVCPFRRYNNGRRCAGTSTLALDMHTLPKLADESPQRFYLCRRRLCIRYYTSDLFTFRHLRLPARHNQERCSNMHQAINRTGVLLRTTFLPTR